MSVTPSLLTNEPAGWFDCLLFVHTKQDLMEDVKAKLDEEMQDTLDSLGCGAEEDATRLYEAMKVRLFLLTCLNFGCI